MSATMRMRKMQTGQTWLSIASPWTISRNAWVRRRLAWRDRCLAVGGGQRGQGGDPVLLQAPHLAAGDAGDAVQVIGRLQPLLGGALPPAPAAVEPGVGHSAHAPAGLEPGEGAAELAVVVEEVA